MLRVKGVPMFYLPVLYYPTKQDDRATGFLIPTYGSSTLRGQSLHNAFFWAINRSQDATFMHDWFSKTGQGFGGEYRYNAGTRRRQHPRLPRRSARRDLHAATTARTTTSPASRSYEIRGSANQLLPGNLRARANVNYFSSIATSQTFNTNIYDASRNQRSFGGNVVGAWGTYSLNGTFDHSEYFYNLDQLGRRPAAGRASSLSRNERPLFGDSPVYFSVSTEFVARCDVDTATDGDTSRHVDDTRPEPRRLHAADPLSVQEVAVVHGQLDRSAGATPTTRAATRRPTTRRSAVEVVDDGPEPHATSPSRRRSSARCSTGSGTRRTTATPRSSSTRSSRS